MNPGDGLGLEGRFAEDFAASLPSVLALLTLILIPSAALAQDTTVVRSSGPPAWGSEVHLVEELRIGALDGPEEETFGSIAGLAILPDSSIWVADRQVPVVRGFRADGSFIANAGGPGEGPGEFSQVNGVIGRSDGTLVVWDHWGGRISTFDREGVFLSSHSIWESQRAGSSFRMDADGHRYVLTRMWGQRDSSGDQLKSWVRYAPDGTVRDTIPVPPRDAVGGGYVVSTPEGHRGPFVIETLHTMGPAGEQIVARNSEYAIHRHLPDGNVLRIERDHEPVEVGSQEHRQWEAYRSHFETMVPATLGEEPQFDPVPRVKPPFRAIRVDGDGRIWVHRHVEAVHHPASSETREARGDRPILEWREPVVHDVFDPDGTYLAQITLPPQTAILAAKGRHIWVRLSGEFGEAYIVRFRIEASS